MRSAIAVVAWFGILAHTAIARADVSPHNSFLSCHPFAARADGQQACLVRVRVRDTRGLPVEGKNVELISDRGSKDVITPQTAVLDEQGLAEFRIQSNAPGTATLTAKCEGRLSTRAIVDNGVVAIYTFDGDSPEARVRDLSGNGNHGTVFGNPQFVAGKCGDAISLNGIDQYVEVPHSASMNGRRGSYIEGWVKVAPPADDNVVRTIAQKSHNNGGDYRLSLRGRKIAYHFRCSQRESKQLEEALSDMPAVASDAWTLAAGFWEGSNIEERVRFHGYVRAYASEAEFLPAPKAQQVEGIWNCRDDAQPFSIGRNGNGSEYLQGLLDEVRVYSRALYDEEMRRNHCGDATIAFGLAPPAAFAADAKELPECVILSWENSDRNVTTFRIYRSTAPITDLQSAELIKVVPHRWDHFRDYEVDYDTKYYYAITSDSFGNESALSEVVSATACKAPAEERWYRGDGHLHTFTHDIDVEDFDPEGTLGEARRQGWDFALVTDHNSLGAFFRSEDQGSRDFIVIGNGEEISNGGEHRTGAFLKHFIPTSDTSVFEQNELALAMGGQVGPNHSRYAKGPPNITLFEVVNNKKWFPLETWDRYLKEGIHVTAKGGSDAHGRFSVKRGYRWCVWSDRLSYRALRKAIQGGRTFAVDGDGLSCMLKVNGAMIGDTLTLRPGEPLYVEVIAAATLGNVSEVKLIKGGEIIQSWSPVEPNWRVSHLDGTFDGEPTYYRLEVRSDGSPRRAVTSAIFVRP